MRRSVIISLAIAMGISFLCLLGLQVSYISEILDMRRIHFQEDVKRSLTQVTHQLEVEEASRYLEQGPEAMTGTVENAQILSNSSRSNPFFTPSVSIELITSSPAPDSIPLRINSRASRWVFSRPPLASGRSGWRRYGTK